MMAHIMLQAQLSARLWPMMASPAVLSSTLTLPQVAQS